MSSGIMRRRQGMDTRHTQKKHEEGNETEETRKKIKSWM